MTLNSNLRKNTLTIALLCAIAVHASLVFIKTGMNLTTISAEQQVITIQINNVTEPADITEDRTEEVETAVQQTAQKTEPEQRLEIASEETDITNDEPTEEQTIITTNINSVEFKQWIQGEAKQHIEKNPDLLSEFAQSFVVPAPEPHETVEKEISPLQTGLYTTRANGKVTCHLQTVLLFHNDFSTTINTSKDCTPRKKFTLNIN